MKKWLIGVGIILSCLQATAQETITISGRVIDKVSEEPLIGVSVGVPNLEIRAIGDIDGKFVIIVPITTSELQISYVGFDTVNFPINVDLGELLILLEPSDNVTYCPIITNYYYLNEIIVSTRLPIVASGIKEREIKQNNLGQDVPMLLDHLPSVTTTSDAGAGVGYTGIRVRGSDATRTNVTINGIPLNDAEGQGVFWVDLPDFASSVEGISMVRGAGTSTNGAGAFGASVNLNTKDHDYKAYGNYNAGYGSFSTIKNAIEFGSGKFKDKFSIEGRLSKITSDGYIDRATSDLQSYYLAAELDLPKTDIEFITFSGKENTYQAWNGVEESLLATDRTSNVYTYENQIDDYKQDHYQFLTRNNLGVNNNFYLSTGLHYTKGKGFFEEFKADDALNSYGIPDQMDGNNVITSSDLVRRRWLDNDFYGGTWNLGYFNNEHTAEFGGAINGYKGNHFGEVIIGEFVPQTAIGNRYYNNDGNKNDANFYTKYTYEFENGLIPYIDLQYRRVNYEFLGKALDPNSGDVIDLPQDVAHNFFNPKAGLSYHSNNGYQFYASVSRAQKEPNRSDYVDAPNTALPKAEKLKDYEVGVRGHDKVQWAANFYFMDYTDQLAITGGVNDVGEYTRQNVENSYRAGLELQVSQRFDRFNVNANATFSQNKIQSFTEQLDNFDTGVATLINHENTDLALSPNVIAGGQLSYEFTRDVDLRWTSKFVGQQFLDNTSTDARSIDPYFVNHLGLHAELLRNKKAIKGIDVNIRVNNILNHTYESNGYTFGYIFGGESIYEEYYYPQAGIHFLSGVSVKF